MGISEAQIYLAEIGYDRRKHETIAELLERASTDAILAGIPAQMAARAIETLLLNRRKNKATSLFADALNHPPTDAHTVAVPEATPHEITEPKVFAYENSAIATHVPDAAQLPEPRIPWYVRPDEPTPLSDVSLYDNPSLLEENNRTSTNWRDRGLCAQTDPETFFPEKGGSSREAKKICLSCEVRSECLEYALDAEERFGVWGGLSERERRRLKKRSA